MISDTCPRYFHQVSIGNTKIKRHSSYFYIKTLVYENIATPQKERNVNVNLRNDYRK